MKKKKFIWLLILIPVLTSCHNGLSSFPDYKYQSVYFSYQYPVRTVTLGTSNNFINTLDNKHEIKIYATMGGAYNNNHNITIDFKVDTSLAKGLLFNSGGRQIKPMPGSYYKLASNKIVIPRGKLVGGVLVHLTDKFFNDTTSTKTTYVIPLKMTHVVNADTILSGKPKPAVSNPKLTVASDWSILPKNFTLYAVKYINRYDGFYLSRGKDVITGKNGSSWDTTIVRHNAHLVNDRVVKLDTKSLNQVKFPVTYKQQNGTNFNVLLVLKFNGQGECTVTTDANNYTATGSGKFVKNGAKDSWGGKDRNVIYLNYKIDSNKMHIVTSDTLVLRNRGVKVETFSPVLN